MCATSPATRSQMAPRKYTPEELQALRERQHAEREARTRYDDPRQVLTIPQPAAMGGTSVPTLNRAIASGNGPPVIQLSKRRRGVRGGDYLEWQQLRVGSESPSNKRRQQRRSVRR